MINFYNSAKSSYANLLNAAEQNTIPLGQVMQLKTPPTPKNRWRVGR